MTVIIKVCMLTSRHFHDDARIFHKQAKTLVGNGFAVTIIAPYRGREVTDRSIPIRIFHKTRYFRKLGTLNQLVKLGLTEKADIYHVHEGDSSFLAGVLIKLLNGIKRKKVFLIYDSHEFWAFLFQDKAPRYLRKVVKWGFVFYEGLLIKFCDAIITANDIVGAYFRFMDYKKPLVRLYNVPILSLFVENEVSLERKRCTFCHEGRILMNRGIEPLMNALVALRQRRTDWKFMFIGEAFDREEIDFFERIFREHPDLQEHVEITGWLPYEEVGKRLELCEIGCIFLEPKGNNRMGGPPNKLFNYMRYGLALIAPAYPEIQKITEEKGCGILLDQITSKSILKAFEYMIDNKDVREVLGQNGKDAVLSQFNWEKESEKLLDLYARLLGSDNLSSDSWAVSKV